MGVNGQSCDTLENRTGTHVQIHKCVSETNEEAESALCVKKATLTQTQTDRLTNRQTNSIHTRSHAYTHARTHTHTHTHTHTYTHTHTRTHARMHARTLADPSSHVHTHMHTLPQCTYTYLSISPETMTFNSESNTDPPKQQSVLYLCIIMSSDHRRISERSTMTTQLQSAWLVDLHPLPHPPSSDHHLLQVVNSKIRNGLTADFHDFQTAQVFVLTSSDSQVDLELDMKSPDVGLTFVQGEDRIESFYQAKKKLDHFEICEVTVVSDGAFKTFWENVCKLLLTPVHHWGIEALHPPNCVLSSDDDCSSSNIYQVKPESFTGNTVKPTLTSGRNPNMTPSREQTSFDSPGPEENHVENPPFVSDEGTKPVDDSLDIVRDMIQRYLQTLPSLLGVPEVDKAQRFPGKGAGFVHGYSTRRGGVTTMPTLCAMNVLYTDKKRDSPLVVQENLSRLARVREVFDLLL